MTDLTLQLGDFIFARFEIPEHIEFGGDQKLIVHELVGGTRIIDAMGEAPLALDWSGFLVGASALPRALYLDALRRAGKPLTLTWSELSYTVVVKALRCDFVRAYRIPYRITCEVVSDNTAPITQLVEPSPEQSVADDLDAANGLAGGIDDGALSSLMAGLTAAISTVGNLATAAQSRTNTVMVPLQAVRDRVGVLLSATNATIANVSTLGGVLPGNALTAQVANLTGQIGAIGDQPSLVLLDRTLGRMQSNIGTINAGTKTVTVGGGNLYALAADAYGDAMGWTALAVANRLDDPELAGIATLSVPPYTDQSGGVLHG
jgi:hypothetical protein